MKHYVVGLAFNAAADRVVLVEKSRPAWQKGKLNGAGGLIEPDEAPACAMQREFCEETGVDISASLWTPIATLRDELATIDIFSCFDDRVLRAQMKTDEPILILPSRGDHILQRGIADLAPLVTRALAREQTGILRLESSRVPGKSVPAP